MSNYYRPRGLGGGFFSFPPIIKNLLIINGVVFFIQLLMDNLTFDGYPAWYILNKWFALNPISGVDAAGKPFNFQVWQLITYQFMHGGFSHILFNMFALWMFGSSIEDIFGSKKFLIFYLLAGVSAGLLHLFVSPLLGASAAVTIGASGSIFGVLIAYAMFFPDNLIFLYFLIPVKAKYLIGFLVVIEFLAVDSASSGVAHLAHLGGALFGFLYIMFDKNSYVTLKSMFKKSAYYKSDSNKNIFSNPFSKTSKNTRDADDANYYDINHKNDEDVSQAEIDAILDKISQSGYQNLSEHEKENIISSKQENEMKFNISISLFFLIFISIAFISCTNSSKIEEKKFVKIYAEIIFMQDTSSCPQSVIKNKVLKKFGVEEIEYDETIKYYNDEPERWQKFFDEVIVYIENLKPKPKKNNVKSLREQS